jgi:hypothetical protein
MVQKPGDQKREYSEYKPHSTTSIQDLTFLQQMKRPRSRIVGQITNSTLLSLSLLVFPDLEFLTLKFPSKGSTS